MFLKVAKVGIHPSRPIHKLFFSLNKHNIKKHFAYLTEDSRALYSGQDLHFFEESERSGKGLSKRKPFRITNIVLPSCPTTPRGRFKNWRKLEAINKRITSNRKNNILFDDLFHF